MRIDRTKRPRGGRMRALRCAEGRQVAVGPSPVDHRRRVLQRPRRGLGVPERHLGRIDTSSKDNLGAHIVTEPNVCAGIEAYESVSPGAAGVLVGDDDGLGDVAELLEVAPHRVALRLPRQAPNKQLSERRVAVHRRLAAAPVEAR